MSRRRDTLICAVLARDERCETGHRWRYDCAASARNSPRYLLRQAGRCQSQQANQQEQAYIKEAIHLTREIVEHSFVLSATRPRTRYACLLKQFPEGAFGASSSSLE